MILKSITPVNFGPFANLQSLSINPEVTVLTGANDTGKSTLLKLIHLMCTGGVAEEREYNRYRIGEFEGAWDSDPKLGCIATFEHSDCNINFSRIEPKDVFVVSINISPASRTTPLMSVTRNGQRVPIQGDITKFPNSIMFPAAYEIGNQIDLTKMNPAEEQFVRLGFGSKFTFEHFNSLKQETREEFILARQEKLNECLKQILPASMRLRFVLRGGDKENSEILRIMMVDEHQGMTPLGSRGTGIRKIVSIMGTLLASSATHNMTYILLDEPETSLHADAQHTLRRVLEGLASRPNIQVIYATHSPSMVNTMRPTAIRVLKRGRVDSQATTIIINDAFNNNYSTVRSSLGLNPSDSLLYAPITVVVEGPSEVRCLPLIFEKLKNAGIEGFRDIDDVLGQTHFLEGGGDSFEYLCRLAKSQGAKPILFLDGDKTSGGSAKLVKKVRDVHPEIPIVTLPEGEDFEQIIPKEKYFEALAIVYEEDISKKLTEESFDSWKVDFPYYDRKAFSKLVEEWFLDAFDVKLNKPKVIHKAIEITEVEYINPEKFRDLVAEMRKVGSLL